MTSLPESLLLPACLFTSQLYTASLPAITTPTPRGSGNWKTKREWDMAFHPAKCSQLPLTRSKKPLNASTSYSLHDYTIERLPSSKYLGFTLQSNLSWRSRISATCAKAKRALGFLKIHLKVFKAMVRPILEHASAVWDSHIDRQTSDLEKVQRRAARYVLNRHRNTSSVSTMLRQLQWP